MRRVTENEGETRALAERLSSSFKGGEIVLLNGELGAGKTTFAKGLAKGLGCRGTVTSPTFTFVREYADGRLPFYHMDLYRVSSALDLRELGLDEYLYGDGVCALEWNRIGNLPGHPIVVNIASLGGDRREIEICGYSE